MKILLDQDEVLCQLVSRVVQYWNEDHPADPKTIEDIRSWDIASNLGATGQDFLRSVLRYSHLYEYLDPVDGAVEGVRELLDMGHQVRVVTHIPKFATTAYDGKCQWLRDHLPFFPLEDFCAYSHKDEVEGDVLLDDGPHNIQRWTDRGRWGVVFERPWNRKFYPTDLPGGDARFSRVRSWSEFLSSIREEGKG